MNISNLNFAFCLPLPGKPNPYEAGVEGKARSRVVLKPQKGNTCSFYALQILRNEKKIGKNCLPFQKEGRAVELLFSEHRKNKTKVDAEFQPRLDLALQLDKSLKAPCNKEVARNLIVNACKIFSVKNIEFCCKTLNLFLEQEKYDNLLDFVQQEYTLADRKINEIFFNHLEKTSNVSDVRACCTVKDASQLTQKKETEITHQDMLFVENNVIFRLAINLYGMKKSNWHPKQSLQALMAQLQAHGPHYVTGQFGQEYYVSPPFKLKEKIEDRPIFGWKAGSQKIVRSDNHAVVIVGAKVVNDKEHVYFIDPLDGSDPKDLTTQKIYVISYQTFRSQIASLDGVRKFTIQGVTVFDALKETENNYALHM